MIELIENIQILAEALKSNEFYDFHDAEIVSIKFHRNDSVTVEVTLQLHRKIAEFEKDGKIFDRYKNFDATFKFSKVYPFQLNDFNHQNVITGLNITKHDEKFIVHFVECFGCDFKFECEKMELIGVEINETEKVRYIPDFEKLRTSIRAARNREKSKN